MNFKKIIIYQYDSLFNILSEISEILNFDVIKADKENFEDFKKDLKNDFLIILKNKNDDFEN